MLRHRHALVATALLSACGQEANVSPDCDGKLVISEVFASNESFPIDGMEDPDWVELFYDAEPTAVLDLSDYSLSNREGTPGQPLGRGSELRGGTYLLLLTTTFPSPNGSHPATGFDLNRDADGVFLRASPELRHATCDSVRYPDQHADFSWSRRVGEPSPCGPAETWDPETDACWCYTRATPAVGDASGENDRCLCEGNEC